jgi:Polysulphide reductase, NrfD
VSEAPKPPEDAQAREEHWVADHTPDTRDMTPALGARGGPASWQAGEAGGEIGRQRGDWADARWSYLFKDSDTSYAAGPSDPEAVARANHRMRTGEMPEVRGPVINAPVWTWEVPLYFWFGGIASGSAFVALACDLAGDHRSAAIARKVAVAAILPSPPLLIADLGRPARFLNMLRIFKPRSPMNLGAWALMTFSTVGSAAVAADVAGLPRAARVLGGANAVVAGYLGSYTGVLLATTAVPVWARSRLFLGPIFISTAAATGAAATRLTLVARGLPVGHPTREALGVVESGAMISEFLLASINERRLGRAAAALEHGMPGRLFKAAKWGVRIGFALRYARGPVGPWAHHTASVLYLASGLGFRYAWVNAGRASATDHEAVARMARGQVTVDDEARRDSTRARASRLPSTFRKPSRLRIPGYAETVRRASLLAERLTQPKKGV